VSDDKILTPSYIVHITDTTTGETRAVRMNLPFYEGSVYWWSEGNASCDCNRGIFFSNYEIALDDAVCGEGRYRVRCVNDNGTVLYEDEEDSA
jgi:hypothetical protein